MKTRKNKDEAPLLVVRDTIERHPKEREGIIQSAIAERELLVALTGGVRDTMRWQLWSAGKSILAVALIFFIAVWTVGKIAALATWITHVQNTEIVLPVPFANEAHFPIGHVIPTSTVIAAASRLPAFEGSDAFTVAAIAGLLVAVEKLLVAMYAWKRVRLLRLGARDLRGEIEELRSWLS